MRDNTINNPYTTWFEVTGHCMAPLIRRGDFVMARAIDELKIGDIVIISGPPQVVHRVVKVGRGDLVLTKGDMNARPDPPLTKGNLAAHFPHLNFQNQIIFVLAILYND
jgi:signal peptidase I